MHNYRSDLSLYRLCLIQVSKNLWSPSAFKNHLVSATDSCYIRVEFTIPPDLRRRIAELPLPESVKDQLKLTVGSMGTRICSWLSRFKQFRDGDSDLADCIDWIHWTHFGSIDLNETIRSLYTCGFLPIGYCTWQHLSRSCVDDCIRDFWYKVSGLCPESSEGSLWVQFKSWLDVASEGVVSERTRGNPQYVDLFAKLRSMKYIDYHIAYYWSQRMLSRLSKIEWEFTRKYRTMNEKMLVLGFGDTNYAVVNYFWKLLNNEQRKGILMAECEGKLRTFLQCSEIEEYCFSQKDQEIDLIAFFLDQMSFYDMNDENMLILRSKLTVMKLLMWPSEPLFISTIEELMTNDKFVDYELILLKSARFMRLYKAYVQKDSNCRELFCRIFEENKDKLQPRAIKDLLIEFWLTKDSDIIKFIIDRERSQESRKDCLETLTAFSVRANWYCDENENYFAFVEKFQSEVLVSDHDRRVFEERHTMGQGEAHRILGWRY